MASRPATRDELLDARAGADVEVLTDDELRHIQDRYVLAARAAARAGFEFVDVKACHGYLLHELLGARQRPGPYGGPDFEDRTRFFVELVQRSTSTRKRASSSSAKAPEAHVLTATDSFDPKQ